MIAKMLSAVAVVLLLAVLDARPDQKGLDDYKTIYETSSQSFEKEYQAKLKVGLDKYGQLLDQAVESMKAAADIKGYEAANNEIKRFKEQRFVPEEDDAGLPDLLLKARTVYRQYAQGAARDRDRKVLDLTAKYIPALEGLKKRLMMKDKIDEAKRVEAELERARFVAADIQSRMPKSEPTRSPRRVEQTESRQVMLQGLLRSKAFREGLILYYPFDGNKKHSVEDRSGKKHHGKIVGASREPNGKVGACLEFDGVDDHILVKDFSLGGPMSVAAWVRYDLFNSFGKVIDFGNGPDSHNIYLACYDKGPDSLWAIRSGNGTRLKAVRAPAFWEAGRWVHAAATVDGAGFMTLYKNGFPVKAQSGYPPDSIKRSVQYVGRSNWREHGFFDGKIDELMVYERCLSKEEVKQLYDAAKGE